MPTATALYATPHAVTANLRIEIRLTPTAIALYAKPQALTSSLPFLYATATDSEVHKYQVGR